MSLLFAVVLLLAGGTIGFALASILIAGARADTCTQCGILKNWLGSEFYDAKEDLSFYLPHDEIWKARN